MKKYDVIKDQLTKIRAIAIKHTNNERCVELVKEIDFKLAEIEALEICNRLDSTRDDILEETYE